jgi:fatty-acyl-CoA synthase
MRTHVAAPLFHTWGFAHFMLSALMGETVVLRRKFDPEECLRVTQEERCEAMVVIPVMLQRIMALPQEVKDRYDLTRVEVVAASGSSLPGDLALDWMDQFGDNLYNLYGSTEVAYASVADPTDLREAPGSAGRPPFATVVRILDQENRVGARRASPAGSSSATRCSFEGYTGGGHKEVVDGLMSSGDVGRIGTDGRPVRRGSRRRDDRLRGRERLPRRDRELPGPPRPRRGGRRDRGRRRRLRHAAAGVRGRRPHGGPARAGRGRAPRLVRQNLARYKVPRDFVFLEELPRNGTGKILKRELAERSDG